MAENTLSRDDLLRMQAQERMNKLSKPRIKDSVLLATIVEFVNSDENNVNLSETYPTIAEPKVRNLVKKHDDVLGGLVWPLTTDEGVILVKVA